MKYTQLPKDLYIRNRAKLSKHLDRNALAVFNSNDVLPTNADGHLPLVQNTDLFYMSGVDQEETILLICPHASREAWKEILFVKETNEEVAIWEGAKLNKKQASEVSGVKTVMWLSQFNSVFNTLMAQSETVYVNTNEHLRAHVEVETRDARFIKKLKNDFPGHSYKRLAPIMHDLRSVKEREEINQLQRACNITKSGVERILKFIKKSDLKQDSNVVKLSKLIDIDNYLDYNIAQVYISNIDAGGNIRYWRERKYGAKWRWILFDTDFGFGLRKTNGVEENTLIRFTEYSSELWPFPSWSSLIIRKLLKNESIKKRYIKIK